MPLELSRIKAERVAKGMTQQELANRLGVNRATYAKREAGLVKLGADELSEIAHILGYSDDQLGIFFGSSSPNGNRGEKGPRN